MTKALDLHKKWQGKIEVVSRVAINGKEDLSTAYTPGVAEPCLEINKNPDLSYIYTRRHNMVAVITDGTAVLGLGDIGGLAGMPVMEGKCVLFKEFAGVDAFPLCVKTRNVDEFVNVVENIADSFGGINLEDIAAPRCFEIERKLKEKLDIPVFHDDQHGTAVVVLAALKNALKVVHKKMEDLKIVVQGAGAAGGAISRLLVLSGAKNVIVCDINGILYKGKEGVDYERQLIAEVTNPYMIKGDFKDAIINADVFIGVSAPHTVKAEHIKMMNKDAIVFAMSNPIPEIEPDEAEKAGALIVGTGRSDHKNQINNVLAFPGIFKGALSVRASAITENMKLAAANAIASLVSDEELCADFIMPLAFDKRIGEKVAEAVAKAAKEDNVARI